MNLNFQDREEFLVIYDLLSIESHTEFLDFYKFTSTYLETIASFANLVATDAAYDDTELFDVLNHIVTTATTAMYIAAEYAEYEIAAELKTTCNTIISEYVSEFNVDKIMQETQDIYQYNQEVYSELSINFGVVYLQSTFKL